MRRKLVCCFCVAVVYFVFSVNAQYPCITPTNDNGICIPISNCTHLIPLVESNTTSAETKRYIENLHCGVKDLKPLVCCVTPELSTDTKIKNSKTLNETSINSDYLEESLTEHELSSRFAMVREETCKTPNNTDGTCKVINSCTPYIHILKNPSKTQEEIKYLQKSYCGKQDELIKVCCPVETTPVTEVTLNSRLSSDGCRTPVGVQGSCISIYSCPPLLSIINNKILSSQNIQQLRDSYCGEEYGKPKVCCPLLSEPLVTMTKVKDNEQIPTSPYLPKRDECGKEQLLIRIRNGQRTSLGEYPWMALLQYSKDNKFHCGGTLINKRYILTAAHCVSGTKLEKELGKVFSIRLGEDNLNEEIDCVFIMKNKTECADPPQNIPVEEIIIHPDYVKDSQFLHNDVALIKLKYEARITDFVRVICLPLEKNLIEDRMKVIVAGWGTTEIDLVNSSPYKLKVPLLVANRNECQNSYRGRLTLHSGQFCAGSDENNGNTCSGDSGGPIMLLNKRDGFWYSLGIISAGVRNCKSLGVPSVFTNVRHYLKWIVSNIRA